jgi:hypothetical protein
MPEAASVIAQTAGKRSVASHMGRLRRSWGSRVRVLERSIQAVLVALGRAVDDLRRSDTVPLGRGDGR